MVLDAHNEFIHVYSENERKAIVDVRSTYYQNKPVDLKPQVCVYYDAWENDNDEDPILSLVYSILNSVDTDYSYRDSSFVKTAASIMEVFTGKDWNQIIEGLKGENPLDGLKQSKNIESKVSEFLQTLLPEKGNRLIVFIDELDRCKPSFAVRLLERIKHYFTDDSITFVFSVNINELQHTIRKHYGDGFDGSRYLDRFFDLRISLPAPDMDKYFRSLAFNDTYYTYDVVCGAIIKKYHFELREIAKFLRIAKIAAYEPTHDDRGRFSFSGGRATEFCLLYIVPIMIALKLHNTKRYMDFIEGRDYTPLEDIANALSSRFFGCLLNNNETFDENDVQNTFVTVGNKLQEVYSAIFVTTYDNTRPSTTIGKLRFDDRNKRLLLRVAGLLSTYTNTNV